MRLNLKKSMFSEKEYQLLTHGDIKVFAFKYSSGVEALRLENRAGHFVILPFKGQQIWDLHMYGKDLTMRTTIKEPVADTLYLKNYGGFLYHCGINSFGVPDDKHPQHGEIPNAEYNGAYITCGEDGGGRYVSVGGSLDYDVAFTKKYRFSPECVMHEDGGMLKINVTLENLRRTPMEYMYLCHMNFAPVDGAKLVYSAPRDGEHIKVHKIVPESMPADKAAQLRGYMEEIEKNPAVMDEVGAKGQIYDPEICFAIKYKTDENGRAYTMQYKEGEGACCVIHPANVLPVGVRWISKTGDEEAMGMILPATSEHLGYEDSKKKGYLKYLAPLEKLQFCIETGYLPENEAKVTEKKINEILGK